jgi:kynurenine formamidase
VRHIDLSHVVEDGMVTYKGLPAPKISDFLSRIDSRARYAPGTEFVIGMIDMCSNTGTYIDSPFHRYPDGADLGELDLERLADVDGVIIDATSLTDRAIGRPQLRGSDVANKAVLVRTGWDRHWRTDAYFTGHPYLTGHAARYLVEQRARIVGIDSFNIDDVSDGERPVHSLLLRAGIPVCEHLTNLAAVPARDFRFSAVPVKVTSMGTFPVRAYATLDT